MAVVIDPQDSRIYDGNNTILFPSDSAGRPSAFLSGLDSNDDPVLGRFTTDGRLKVDASVTIDSVDIGDVNTLLKVGGVNQYLGGVLNPDLLTYAAYVQDQRMSFNGGSLNVAITGQPIALAGEVNILNAADATINPSTEETLFLLKSRADLLATESTLNAIKLQADKLTFNGFSSLQTKVMNTTAEPVPAVIMPGEANKISGSNSTSTPLGANAVFTGAAEDILHYSTVSIFVHASHVSATNGMRIEWSSNGINWDDIDSFTVGGNGTHVFTFGSVARYFRIVYTNGAVAQTSFRLQTIMHQFSFKASSHKISSAISGENDAELMLSVLVGRDISDGQYKNVGVSGSRLLVSQEPPQPPAGTTPVVQTGDGLVAGSADTLYVIPSGSELTIQRINAGSASVIGGTKTELYYDPAGTGVGMTLIQKIFMNGSNEQADMADKFIGDGTRRILMRRTNIGGGSVEIFARWTGYTTP